MERRRPPSIWRKAIEWMGFERWGWDRSGHPVSSSTVAPLAAVGERAALMVSTVYSCVTLYSGLYASLPLEVHQGSEAGGSIALDDHAAALLLNTAPNAEQTAADFFEFIGFSLELWQNAYLEKQMLGSRVVGLLPLQPAGIRAVRMSDGRLRYRGTSDGRQIDLPSESVIHIRGAGGLPLGATPLLHVARDAIRFSQEAQAAATSIMQNGLRPSGVLSVKDPLKPEQRAQLEKPLVEKFLGSVNAGRPMVLDNGAKFEVMSIDPDKAQMLESRGFSVEEICRFWGVPPVWIGHTEKQTSFGTGVEQQLLGFVKLRLTPRLRKIEQALSRGLLTPADRAARRMIRFQMDDFMRGDMTARGAFYKSGREGGWLTPDDIRGWEGLPPLPDGKGQGAEPPSYARVAVME